MEQRKPQTSKGFRMGESKVICPECKGGKVNLNNPKEECTECEGTGYAKGAIKTKKITRRERK